MRKVKFTRLFSLLLIGISLILIAGCSKDDDDNDDNNGSVSIVGTWTLSDVTVEMTIDGVSYVDYLINLGMTAAEVQAEWVVMQADMMPPSGGSVEFKENGSFVISWDFDPNATWSIANNKLTIISDGDIMIFDIITLTSSVCKIRQTITEFEDFDDDDQNETLVMIMEMIFSR